MYVTLLPSPYYCIDHNTMGATDIGDQAPSRSAPGPHMMAGARAHISYIIPTSTNLFTSHHRRCMLWSVPAPTGRPLRRRTAPKCTVS